MNVMAVSFWCSLVFLAIGGGIFAWLYFKKKAGKPALTMTAIVAIGLALIALRMFYYSEKTDNPFLQFLVSTMDAIRYFAMGKVFDPSQSWRENPYYTAYCTMEILLSVIAPLCTATVLASLLRTILDQVRLTFRHSCPVYYFSELNERSMTLAKSLSNRDPADSSRKQKPKIIFCKADRSPIRAEAQALGAVTVGDPIHLIRLPDPTVRQVRVFLMDDNEDNNIQSFLKMQDQLCVPAAGEKKDRPESDFLVFSTQESAELVFDEALALLDKNTLAYDLRLINETRQVTQQLLVDHPLFEAAEAAGNNRISVLVVGCGYLGTQIVKTAMVCGMMDSYDFRIQVIDDQADRLERQFLHEHPFLAQPSRIFPAGDDPQRPALAPAFYQANVCTTSFDAVLEAHCANCNYIVVATGDDQLNITTALYLRRWYTRRVLCEKETENVNPLIFAAVRSPERYRGMKELERSNRADSGYCGKLYLFANNMEIYSDRHILHRPLDSAAAMLNSCYSHVKKTYDERNILNWNDEVHRVSKQRLLRLPVMTQRSNQLTALHSLYKMQDLLQWSKNEGIENGEIHYSLTAAAQEDITHTFFRLARLMNKRGTPLHDLEHRRWTLFHALNGWLLYPHDQLFAQLSHSTGAAKPHKNTAARLHGCMIPSSELNAFAAKLKEKTGTRQDFKKNDQVMCLASLFIWMELSMEPDVADTLISRIRENLSEDQASREMLDQLRAIGKTLDKTHIPS